MNKQQDKITCMITPEEEKLVYRTTKKVCRECGMSFNGDTEGELYSWGITGLLEAKKKYDQTSEIPFLAFAAYRIRGAMLDHLRKAAIVRLPQQKHDDCRRIEAARKKLERENREPSIANIALELGWTEKKVRESPCKPQTTSLTRNENGDGDAAVVELDIPSSSDGPEKHFLKQELINVVQQCLNKIRPATDRLILLGQFAHGLPLRHFADQLACSIQTVANRRDAAKESMQRCLKSQGWDEDSMPEIMG